MQVRLILLASLLFVSACERAAQEYEPLKVQNNELKSHQFVGVWMIDDESLQFLRDSLGFNIYTRAADHVLLLNNDATCAFKGFSLYLDRKFLGISERDDVNDIENSLNQPRLEIINDRFCWCEVLKDFPYLAGPYEKDSAVTNTTSRVFRKTLWSSWRICRRERPVALEDYTQFRNWEFKICLERPEQAHLIVIGDSVNMYIGKDKKGVYLMIPAVIDDNAMRLGVKYRMLKKWGQPI